MEDLLVSLADRWTFICLLDGGLILNSRCKRALSRVGALVKGALSLSPIDRLVKLEPVDHECVAASLPQAVTPLAIATWLVDYGHFFRFRNRYFHEGRRPQTGCVRMQD